MANENADNIGVFSDLELERQLLRYIAFSDASLIPHIDAEIFYGTDERIIFDVLKNLQTTFPEKIWKGVIAKRIEGSTLEEIEPTINDIIKSPKIHSSKAAKVLLQDLQDLQMQRTIIENANAAINFAKEEMVPDAISAIHSIIQTKTKQKIDSGDYVADYEEREAIVRNNAKQEKERSIVIPTGIIPFDKASGGLRKGEVGMIVGQTGGAKSTAKLNFCIHAYRLGYNVAHFGLEMGKHENQFRADSIIADIPANLFRMSALKENDYKQWKERIVDLRKARKNYMEFVGAKNLSLTEILSLADGIENKYGQAIDLLIIDHVVLVKGEGKRYKDFHMQQWDLMDRLTSYAVEQKKGVWSSAQSTDEGVSRKKGMRVIDVKYARAFSEFANILIALYQSEIDAASGDFNFAIRKGRGIAVGQEIRLKPDLSRYILDEKSFAIHNMSEFSRVQGNKNGNRKTPVKSNLGKIV